MAYIVRNISYTVRNGRRGTLFHPTSDHDYWYKIFYTKRYIVLGEIMNSPMFTSVIFSIIVLMLPNYSSGLFNTALIAVVGIGFFLPFAFSKKLVQHASVFYDSNHGIGKKFLSLHGIVFLSIFQVFALLFSVDYLLSQFIGEAHNLFLVGIVVIAGLVSVTGSQSLLRSMNVTTSTVLMLGLFILLVNKVFIHAPLYVGFNILPFIHYHGSTFSGPIGSNSIVSMVALGLIIFWLVWLEMSELQRMKESQHSSVFHRSIISSGIFLFGVFVICSKEMVPNGDGNADAVNTVNMLVSLCCIGGLAGVFISTFSSVGSMFANTVYPQFRTSVGSEKQLLVTKLATVFSVILSILFIPAVRDAGSEIIMWYIYFLAMFSAPIVTAFFFSMIGVWGSPLVLSISIMFGSVYTVVEFVVQTFLGSSLIVDTSNVFVLTFVGALVTVVVFLLFGKGWEIISLRKVLSRTKTL